MSNKTNIIFLVTSLGAGGAEKFILDFVSNVNIDKFEITVISIGKNNEFLPAFHKLHIFPILLNMGKNLPEIRIALTTVHKIIIEKKISLIHAHLVHGAIFSVLLKMFYVPRIKIVFTAHTINIEGKIREVFLWITRSFRNADILFSKEMVQYFNKKPAVFLPVGIAIDEYKLVAHKNSLFTYISIGRLVSEKNHYAIVKAASYLIENGIKDFQILIIGKGNLYSFIEQKISENSLQNHVKLLGYRTDIAMLCKSSHVFLMPSIWEGLPLSILEAAVCQLPIISTPVGSIPNLIDNEFGYLCQSEDFGKTMLFVKNNYSEALEKSDKLRNKVENEYSIQKIIQQHEALYLEITNNE